MKVLINAELRGGGHGGGIEQFVMGLVYGLGRLQDGPEEYIVIAHRRNQDWLKPYFGPNQTSVAHPRHGGPRAVLLSALHPGRYLWRAARKRLFGYGWLPESSGFYESLGGDVIHFPFQRFIRSELPSVFNPHDLQHLHHPEMLPLKQVRWRESTYPQACREAQAVVAVSQAVKDDLVAAYGIAPEKIFLVPQGSTAALYPEPTPELVQQLVRKYALHEPFALYPAQTWAHKNHIRLLEAVRLLRDRHSFKLRLVCVGQRNEYWPEIEKELAVHGLSEQATFLGFVEPVELRALYRLAQFMVFPSLFEGGGLPVVEAFGEGLPVACSDIPSLKDHAGDAVLTFDPTSVESIASALLRMATDADLRTRLRARGQARACLFTWERSARIYRALYRKIGGGMLTDEDRDLLRQTSGPQSAAFPAAEQAGNCIADLPPGASRDGA